MAAHEVAVEVSLYGRPLIVYYQATGFRQRNVVQERANFLCERLRRPQLPRHDNNRHVVVPGDLT